MLKRIFLLLTAAMLVAVMLVVTAGPALAQGLVTKQQCKAAKPLIKAGWFEPFYGNQGQCIQVETKEPRLN